LNSKVQASTGTPANNPQKNIAAILDMRTRGAVDPVCSRKHGSMSFAILGPL